MTDERNRPEISKAVDVDRRDFLRKSVYIAYATPVITALLVEKASAVTSGKTGGTTDPPPPPPSAG